MKPIFFTVLLVLSAACGGSELKGESNDNKQVQIDDKQDEGRVAACDQEIEIDCVEGTVDGCGVSDESGASLTLSHICTPATETAAGPPCEQEIARVCDEGFVDACLLTPAAASTHVCVQAATEEATEVEDMSDSEEDPDGLGMDSE